MYIDIFILWPVFQRSSYSVTYTRNLLSLIDDLNYGIGKRECTIVDLLFACQKCSTIPALDEAKEKSDFPSTNKKILIQFAATAALALAFECVCVLIATFISIPLFR